MYACASLKSLYLFESANIFVYFRWYTSNAKTAVTRKKKMRVRKLGTRRDEARRGLKMVLKFEILSQYPITAGSTSFPTFKKK